MIKIHRIIWKEIRRPLIDISCHIIVFCLNISGFWIMIQYTDILFPSMPLVVKAFAIISEIAMVKHFAKESL
jgi:hypothetical protein